MKKLKILYHHRVAAQDGQSVHIRELTDSFKALGHEVIFVGPSLRPREFGKDNKLLGLIRRLLPQFAQEFLEILYGLRAYSKLKKAYNDHKPDILYERYNLFLTAGARLKKKTGIPYLVEINAPLSQERALHSGLALKRIARRMEAKTWQAADMAFPVTNVLAEYVKKAGVSRKNITVIQNGINLADYGDIDSQSIRDTFRIGDRTLLGFTGFLRDWHRLDRIIKMIARFDAEKSPHLLVVGNGPAVPACKQLAKDLKIANRIHFAGFTEREDIPRFVSAMDITLQPAVTDYASPLKIFEYMAAGTAIVAPDQANIREIVTHLDNALLFTPLSDAEAETHILSLITLSDLRQKLGKAARETITQKGYTWQSNAERITVISENLLTLK